MTKEQTTATDQSITPQSKHNLTWLWIIIALSAIVGIPVLGCGAFGAGLALVAGSGAQQSTLGPSIGVIRIEGPIVSGQSTTFGSVVAGSESVVEAAEQAQENPNIKAVLIRINSPGGEVVASDEMYHALSQIDKPVVVSMGSLAASGGYYVAMSADYIYATPHTLTGSIGVISQFITAEDLLDDLGVDVTIITAGESKDFGSFSRDMTDEEREYWQNLLAETHNGFIDLVASNRSLEEPAVREVADGRVFSGTQAVDLGLIDEVGYMDDAIAYAAEAAGIDGDPRLVELITESTLLEELYGLRTQQDPAQIIYHLLTWQMFPTIELLATGH